MKNILDLYNNFKEFLARNKKTKIIIYISILAGVAIFFYYNSIKTQSIVSYQYVKVEKSNLEKTVEGSGKVVAENELDIQQLSGGKVTQVLVKPGDYVKKGQIIARLDSRQAAIQVASAKASYDKLINGSSQTDIDILNQNLNSSKASYNIVKEAQDNNVRIAKRNLLNSGIVARSIYDSRVTSGIPIISGTYNCADEVTYRVSLNGDQTVSVTGGTGHGVRLTSVPQSFDSCDLYIAFDTSIVWSSGEWEINIPNNLAASYTTNLNAYNTSLINRDQALLSASSSIISSELNLNQKTIKPRKEDVVLSAANLSSANLAYENTIIRAPFDGQIGSVSAIVGQQTSTQTGVATIITKNKIAEVSLNEVDVVDVKVGQDVNVKLAAVPNTVFRGKVSQIDTVGISSSNVVSFNVKIAITDEDERIKSGMSVTAYIITDSKVDVLSVPSGSIKTEIGKKGEEKSYVLKKITNTNSGLAATNTKVYIEVGLSNDIDSEVVSGLIEGDEVVNKTIDDTAAVKATPGISLFGSPRGGAGR